MESQKITGLMIEYYLVCQRKLWLFTKGIRLEDESEHVSIGKTIDGQSFSGVEKHLMILDTINIDFSTDDMKIHEVKKSNKLKEISIWQLKYYLHFLKEHGVDGLTGVLHVPSSKQKEDVFLTEEDIASLRTMCTEILRIIQQETPPAHAFTKICESCAYYPYCAS
jgi:CRISPR-associated exonuclease Cas4